MKWFVTRNLEHSWWPVRKFTKIGDGRVPSCSMIFWIRGSGRQALSMLCATVVDWPILQISAQRFLHKRFHPTSFPRSFIWTSFNKKNPSPNSLPHDNGNSFPAAACTRCARRSWGSVSRLKSRDSVALSYFYSRSSVSLDFIQLRLEHKKHRRILSIGTLYRPAVAFANVY